MSTAPFTAATAALITGPHEQTWSLAAYQPASPSVAIPLAVESGEVTFDEAWAPYVRATLRCALPAQSVLDQLDPRLGTRVRIYAGYRWPNGTADIQQIADLGIRTLDPVYPDGSLTITLASDEALIMDFGVEVLPHQPSTQYTPGAAISLRLPDALPGGYAGILNTLTGGDPLYAWIGEDWWGTLADWADRVGGWLRDRGDRTWVAGPRPTLSGTPDHTITTGSTGTVTAANVPVTREGDQWANLVEVYYETPSGPVIGRAWISAGPYAALNGSGEALPGIKVLREKRTTAATVTGAAADAAAAAILQRSIDRSRSAITTSVAAWWLRPGHTVDINLLGAFRRTDLVAAVTFNLPDGLMTVRTRSPYAATIST